MRWDASFSEHLNSFRDRLSELAQGVATAARSRSPLLKQAVQELETALEELTAVDEQFRRQSEELLAVQERLDNERQRYRDLFDFAPDAYLVTDARGVIREANLAAGTLLRMLPEFLAGRSLLHFFAETDVPEARRMIAGLRHTHRVEGWHARVQPRSASTVHVAVSVTAILGPEAAGGDIVGMRWLLRDITDRVQAQESIVNLNNELEGRVAQRTADLEAATRVKEEALAREKVLRAQADEANKAKDRFLAILSHELRTPLTPILAAAEELRRHKGVPEDTREGVELICRNASAQGRLINDLLDMARIVHGKLELKRGPVDVHEVLSHVRQSAAAMAEAKSMTVRAECRAARPHVDGDAARLEQVFLNLLTNAIKFTPARGRVVMHTRNDAEGRLVVSVSDNGIGIARASQRRIFESFEQSHQAGESSQGGLGLGLSIVRSLVDAHGGAVSVESAGKDQGSTFVVTLPTIEPAPEAAARHAPERAGNCKSRHVLIVEDHPDTRYALERLLRGLGHQVRVAGTVREAHELLAREAFDVVLTDLGLPDGTGYDVLSGRGKCPRLVALTGYASPEDVQRSLALGFAAHLVKPVSLEQLRQAVCQIAP